MSEATPPPEALERRELLPGGNEPPAPRVAPETEGLDRRGLEAAAAYAGQHASRALMVARHGHIVFERYWHGTSFESLADSQSFARLPALLATGRALSERRIGWLDEPIGQLIAELRTDARGSVTVRALLTRASGPAADSQLLTRTLEHATGERYAQYVSRVLWRRVGAADAWLLLDRPGGIPHTECCMRVRQGDWLRIAELLLEDGKYRGEEVLRPGWIGQLRLPSPPGSGDGFYLPLDLSPPAQSAAYATRDVLAVRARGGNRMWIVPSLHLAVVRIGRMPENPAEWDDARIPNSIIHAARDYVPPPKPQDLDVSKLVPQH